MRLQTGETVGGETVGVEEEEEEGMEGGCIATAGGAGEAGGCVTRWGSRGTC